MLVPLTSTQPARPPKLCGRQNQSSSARNASWAAKRAMALACRSRGRRAARGGVVTTLLLIAESHRGALAGRVVLRRTDRGQGCAAGVAKLPTPEGAGLDRRVDVGRDRNCDGPGGRR